MSPSPRLRDVGKYVFVRFWMELGKDKQAEVITSFHFSLLVPTPLPYLALIPSLHLRNSE